MAQLKWQLGTVVEVRQETPRVTRSFDDVIYREELDQLSANDPSLSVIHTLTRRQPPNWMSYSRRIDRAMLADTAWQPAENRLRSLVVQQGQSRRSRRIYWN